MCFNQVISTDLCLHSLIHTAGLGPALNKKLHLLTVDGRQRAFLSCLQITAICSSLQEYSSSSLSESKDNSDILDGFVVVSKNILKQISKSRDSIPLVIRQNCS